MEIDLTGRGLRLTGAGGRVGVGPGLPAATLVVDGKEQRWAPANMTLDAESGVLRATGGPGGATLELEVRHAEDGIANTDRANTDTDSADSGGVELLVRLCNEGPSPIGVAKLTAFATGTLRVGEDSRRWRTYRNGYQSWSGTRTVGGDDADADVPTRLARLGVTDAKHRSPSSPGHVRSDAVSAICEPVSGDALGIGFTTLADSFGFVELVAPHGVVDRLEIWSDHDGVPLASGASLVSTVRIVATNGYDAGWRALDAVVEAAALTMGARGRDGQHPAGWCSWYYYFAKVTEADVHENLGVLAADGRDGPTFGCEYVMVDDGHQSQLGDWLETSSERFPSGMPDLAKRIADAGFDAGIWWAPFVVHPASRVAQEHPEWLVRNERGRPITAVLNPVWSVTAAMRALDTTHPEVLEHLRHVAGVLGSEWGYAIQKLDFLYAASLPGVRHDPTATRAQALRRGLEAIRAGAGDEAFLLGCGCPLGPAVGVVDAMRIGADVTTWWSNAIDRVGGRGRHALATRNAVINILTRAVLDQRWWLNDPDCLMVRDTDTKLDEEEVRLLATVIGMTDGMIVISDRLSRLGDRRREMVGRTRALAGGRVEVPDLFERDLPELIVSRHPDRTDVAVLNLGDRPVRRAVDLRRRGVAAADGEIEEFWTGRRVSVTDGLADVGTMPAHSARVLQLPTPG